MFPSCLHSYCSTLWAVCQGVFEIFFRVDRRRFQATLYLPLLLSLPLTLIIIADLRGFVKRKLKKICNFFSSVCHLLLAIAVAFTSALIPTREPSQPCSVLFPLDTYYYNRFYADCKMGFCTKKPCVDCAFCRPPGRLAEGYSANLLAMWKMRSR